MPPARPRDKIAGQNPQSFFGGSMLYLAVPPPPSKSFLIRATFSAAPPPSDDLTLQKLGRFPVSHFHPFQAEFFRVLQGSLTLIIEGSPQVVTKDSGEVVIPPWTTHQLAPTPGSNEDLVVEVCADKRDDGAGISNLDVAFFENWTAYQQEAVKYGYELDFIQIMAMWDAGDCVLPIFWWPKWLPGGKVLAYWRGVVVGRWIGGMLGYSPFYKEWTTGWNEIKIRMESTWWRRTFTREKDD